MAIDLARLERGLESLDDARALAELARRYLDAWPDMHGMARATAAQCLRKHTGKRLDPDKVWWHRFDGASNSARSFTGWQHSGPPAESLRLTQLVVSRFDNGFQSAPDVLDLYSGFYYQGTEAAHYDERNEIAMLPSAVMADLWETDFAVRVRQRTERFWSTHGADFQVLARARLLAAVEEARKTGLLEESDRTRLYRYLGVDPRVPPTLQALKNASGDGSMTAHGFSFGSGHFFTLRASDERVVLYTPTTAPVLQAFADHGEMVKTLAQRLHSPDAQAWVNGLYRVDERWTPAQRASRLRTLRDHAGSGATSRWPFGDGYTLTGDLLAELTSQARHEMQVGQAALVSNADLRRQLWRGYLGAFMQVFGGFAPMAWPISLVLVGASITRLGLDIDTAVRARSQAVRKEALVSAAVDTVVALFAMVDVGMGVKALGYRPPPHERLGSMAPYRAVEPPAEVATELEMAQPPALSQPADGLSLLEGVSVAADGSTWVRIDTKTYRVRYSTEMRSWLVVRPDAPYAFGPLQPVRLGEGGKWQWLGIPRLAGGAPGELEVVGSQFWDFYMEENDELNQQLNMLINERQRAVLDQASIPTLEEGGAAPVDEHGYEYVLSEGQRRYTYWWDGEYFNDLLHIYTDEFAEANHLFRHGPPASFGFGDGDVHAYVRALCDSLDELPRSNKAVLWRGGHASRGTSGLHLRSGALSVGDVLVTTDVASFTENPYVVRDFAAESRPGSQGQPELHFDDSSVVFELPYQGYQSGIPISPLSRHLFEAETVMPPGRCLRIESISEVRQPSYRFVWVKLREVPKPMSGPLFDLRTGAPFQRAEYATRVGDEALVERLFPVAQWGSETV